MSCVRVASAVHFTIFTPPSVCVAAAATAWEDTDNFHLSHLLIAATLRIVLQKALQLIPTVNRCHSSICINNAHANSDSF